MNIIEGDLLEIKMGVILHQVNCIGVTGGLAGALKKKWRVAFRGYSDTTHWTQPWGHAESLLGSWIAGQVNPDLSVIHIFGQMRPGPNTDLQMVEKAIAAFAKDTPNHPWSNYPMYAPYKMGCGLGGGDWKSYSTILAHYLPDLTIVRKHGYDL